MLVSRCSIEDRGLCYGPQPGRGLKPMLVSRCSIEDRGLCYGPQPGRGLKPTNPARRVWGGARIGGCNRTAILHTTAGFHFLLRQI